MNITAQNPEYRSLKEYQASILARLESAKSGNFAQGTRYLAVKVRAQFLLIPMSAVKEAMSLLEMFPVPLTKHWLLGMANVRGTLYGITDLACFIDGVASEVTSSSRILLLNDEIHPHVGLMVDQLIGIRRLESMRIIDSEPPPTEPNAHIAVLAGEVEDKTQFYLDTIYEDAEQKRWQIFDVEKLTLTHAFMHPT